MKQALSIIGICLLVSACAWFDSKPAAPPPPQRSSADMIEECQKLLKQGYSVGTIENPRATFKLFGDLTTIEISANYKGPEPDAKSNPVGFRCLFEKGKLFQAGSAVF